MSLGNWGQSFLKDAAGGFFGSTYLRDYTHASKTFRTNSYQNTPKFKYLFHTYFEINPIVFQGFLGGRLASNVSEQSNFGLLVKEVKLPTYSFNTVQLNQYNRKRIVQTKIKYDPIEITFHDDNGDTVNSMWEAYYTYYYNDAKKPNVQFGGRSNPRVNNYNNRNIYNNSISGDDDWGYNSVPSDGSEVKVPFFKNITVFGFNQHNYTAYTLINPIITSFQHDQYNYNEGNGIMSNRMSIDYETVVYNYGAIDGRAPGDIVTGFGNPANYDRTTSPIQVKGANGTILGQGGLVDAVGGTIDALKNNNILGAIKTAGTAYNTFKNTNLKTTLKNEVLAGVRNAVTQTPNTTRNALFNFPVIGAVPSLLNTAAAAVTGAVAKGKSTPTPITQEPTAGSQYNGTNLTNGTPPPDFYPGG